MDAIGCAVRERQTMKPPSDEKLKALAFGIIEIAGGHPGLWEAYSQEQVAEAVEFLRDWLAEIAEEADDDR